MTDAARGTIYQWLQPGILLPMIAFIGGLWVSAALQAERIEFLRSKVEMIEREYQRRGEVAIERRAIDMRLTAIEIKIDRLVTGK